MEKYYAQNESGQIRKILASSDDEAVERAKKLFGTENVTVGKLQHKEPKIPMKEQIRYGKMFGVPEDVTRILNS